MTKQKISPDISQISRAPLLPSRHDNLDFFVCDIFDAAPKGDIASMEHPIFSLSTKPDRRIRRYESPDRKKWVEIKPSAEGLATIHDRDILIYCISQLIAALNDGKMIVKTVRFKAHDLLVATNRTTAGTGYQALKLAFERLRGTSISTNIITGGQELFEVFGLIERASIIRETREGRMQDVEITLSDWVFNAIRNKEVLTLNRNYFRLRKPLERRIYEIGRKHCGRQKIWRISLDNLRIKCGSNSTLREFRRLVNQIVHDEEKYNHMPDYAIRMQNDVVFFYNKGEIPDLKTVMVGNAEGIKEHTNKMISKIKLNPLTYEEARLKAPGWDIYALEKEWRDWIKEVPKHPEKAFIGFCKAIYKHRGRP
jgi:plasmid replication initiation protein